ncbi:TipJ family phage tail tip protein [Escherichia coli]|uniref:TipJ family phage tail tip protein n=10 Tax=Escherichia coli TaxID=562 RepID=UPI00201A42CC|nr:tail fiber domain-containing protein [Escherichia coli]WRX97443.1 tail fiber domain-containing protein [Escherichia coli]
MGKGSSKGHTPREAKDNLKSTQLLSVIDAISEGPVEGPVDGLKSVLLNSTPVLDTEGNTNISGVTVVFRAGEQEQTPPEGFESSGSETVLGTEVKYDTPITRTITSANIDRLRFTFGVQALVETTSKGDRNPSEVRLLVQIQRNGGWVTEKDITIKGKTTSQYLASVVVDNLPPRPFNIRIGKTHLAQELWTQIDNGQLAPDLTEIRTSITDVSNEITQTVNKKLEDQSAAIQQIQKVQVDTNNNLNSMWAVKLQQMQDGRLYIAGNSAQAAADSQTASANSATAAKKSETNAKNSEAAAKSSETNAKASETNAKSSETNAAKSAADALNYRNQAQLIVGDNIGLGSAPRDCPDISGNPSGYIGFMRIMSNAKGFPSIASGESSLTGFISQVDGTPAYTGVFQGWATRSLYTYRWNPTIGPQWTRHARKDEVIRFQRSSDTRTIILSTDVQADGCYLQVDADGQWGAFNPKAGRWQPLAVAQGGTGANDASTARSKLEVMFEAKTGLDANTNLNDIKGTTAGFYYQPMSANAKPELNYPIQLAGALLVQRTGANGSDGCIQSYFVYNNSSILYRRIYTSTQGWSVWKKIVLTERIEEGESTTYVYSNYSPSAPRLQVSTSGLWGCHNGSSWVPLPIGQGGTNAATVDGARTNLGLGRNNSPQLNSLFLDRYSDSTNTYTSSGILHTRLLATDSTVRLGADMYVETLSNEPGQLTIRFTYDGSTGASKYLNLNSEGNLIVDSAILKSTVEKPLQIRSANPAIRFNETDRPANTPTYTLIANAGDWFIQKRDYDDAGSVSNAIAYNFANDRIDVQNLKASGLITANSGIATLTGHDWNAQHTDNVDKFRSIAGSTNGPAGSMVLGGIHVQFSKNYAVQFGGRNSGFWGRTIENGTTQEWKKLLTVDDLNSSTDIAVRSLTTSNPIKSGGGRIDVLGSTSDYSKMDCFVRGFDSTGNSLAWALGSSVGVSKMLSLKNFFSGAEILLNGNDGAVQLKTGAVNGATAQALTINKDEVNSTVDLTLTKQTGTGNRFVLQNLGNTELPFAVKVWGSGDRQNVFEVGTTAAYLFYAQKTSSGQLFDVNGAINCTTLNQLSDRELKDNIQIISDATEAIRKMNGYTYTLKENGLPYAGVIAQEAMEAIPEAVGSFTHYGKELQGPTVDGNELREETRYLNVDYAAVTGLLVQVARETDDRVTALEEENTTLRQNLATAGTRITTLENQVSELVALVGQLTGSEH